MLDVPEWPGHLAGQHLDVRLTAPDGYRASRSYSIASAWTGGDTIELTVEQVPDGEVSSYLVDVLKVGDPLEIRGPVGGWFVWKPEQEGPVQLIGGGSGVVPLRAMLRAHAAADSTTPVRLIYSVRRPASVIYVADLKELAALGRCRRTTRLHARGAGGGAAGRADRCRADRAARVPARGRADDVRVRADAVRGDGGGPAGRGRPRPGPGENRAVRTDRRIAMTRNPVILTAMPRPEP